MGRGRAKAKQTKVARALKYGGPQTDLERLQAELAGGGSPPAADIAEDATDEYDEYSQHYSDDDDRRAG